MVTAGFQLHIKMKRELSRSSRLLPVLMVPYVAMEPYIAPSKDALPQRRV
jgi:hypothetical protein